MKKHVLILISLLMATPVMAADDAARRAQCESWAVEEGLNGQEANEYIAHCMDENQDTAIPEDEDATKASK